MLLCLTVKLADDLKALSHLPLIYITAVPQGHCTTRWLSVYECASHTLSIIDVLTILFYNLLLKDDRVTNLHYIIDIYRRLSVSEEKKTIFRSLNAQMKNRKFTIAGRERVVRICDHLFKNRKQLICVLKIYTSVLPLLRRFTLLFQKETPMIHSLYYEMEELLRDFLGFIVKPEVVLNKSGRVLVSVNVRENALPVNDIFFGSAREVIETVPHLKQRLKEAYISTAEYLQQKMPYKNSLLRYLTALSPTIRSSTYAQKFLFKLAYQETNILSSTEKIQFDSEVRKYSVDLLISAADDIRLDSWWHQLSDAYPILSKLAKSLLSIISAPEVERSFSQMRLSVTEKTARLQVDTVDALLSVKRYISAQSTSSPAMFGKRDILHDPVPQRLVNKMRCAYKRRENNLNQKKSTKPSSTVSKAERKRVFAEAAKIARKNHRISLLKNMARIKRKRPEADDQVLQSPAKRTKPNETDTKKTTEVPEVVNTITKMNKQTAITKYFS